MNFTYGIVGNGIAGYSAAKEIRKHDKDGTIALISAEPYGTYYRIKITELICQEDIQNPSVCNIEWYEDNQVDEELNIPCVKIDPLNRVLSLADGRQIQAEKILLATGAHAFRAPVKGNDLEGVFALRDYDDLMAFRAYVTDKKRIAVFGGGILGLEAAHSLKKLGKEIFIVERSDYLMSRQVDRELGLALNKDLEALGYNLVTGKNTLAFSGEGKVERIEFADGSQLEVDAILMSTGVRPNLDLVRDTGLEIGKGLIVDEKMRTNIPNIFGAGDLVEVYGRTLGLWTAAMDMGKVAGAVMAGQEASYEQPKLFTKLDMGPIQIFSVGDISQYDEVYKYKSEGENHRLFVTNGIVTGGVLTGNTKSMGKVKNYVFKKAKIEDVQKEIYPFEK